MDGVGSWGCPVPGRAHDPAASVVEGVVMCVRESTLAAALVDGCVLGCVEVHVQSLWLDGCDDTASLGVLVVVAGVVCCG